MKVHHLAKVYQTLNQNDSIQKLMIKNKKASVFKNTLAQ